MLPELTELDEFRLSVMRNLARDPELRDRVTTTNDEGNLPIVVAFANERLATLLARVSAAGGYATVFVSDEDHVHIASFIDSRCAIAAETAENLADVPEEERPHPNVSIGMFLTFLKGLPNGLTFAVKKDASPPIIRQSAEVQFA